MNLFARMDATGIGYAGIDGAWWRPAARPFTLPTDQLQADAAAIFALLDAVGELYGTPDGAACGLDALLERGVPAHIPRVHSRAPVLALRPDFQLRPVEGLLRDERPATSDDSSSWPDPRPSSFVLRPSSNLPVGFQKAAFVATELEICPSAQGFAHAMQVGYGLEPELARAYAALLGGRELLVVCAAVWSEFLFDQLAFCRALAEQGARARVLCDLPPARIAEEARRGERWRPPIFGVARLPAGWDPDLEARIDRHGLAPHLVPGDKWPERVGDAVVFRFGYLGSFAPWRVALLERWERGGATFLNPISFIYDSKVVMATLQLPLVRERVAAGRPGALAALDRCIPESHLLGAGLRERLLDEREGWVLKYAGYDTGEDSWGGRSLRVGAAHTPVAWAALVDDYLTRPWPCLAQRAVPTARIAIDYIERSGETRTLAGPTRLRAFLLRTPTGAHAHGAHLTVAASGAGVSEGTDAVQAPIVGA